MFRCCMCVFCVLTVLAIPGAAQTVAKKSAAEIQKSYEAHKGDFDYLLGDWSFTAKAASMESSRVSGARFD